MYLFYGDNDLPLYIGKANNLRQRILSHFSADHRLAKEMSLSQQVRRIDWIETEGKWGLCSGSSADQTMATHSQPPAATQQ